MSPPTKLPDLTANKSVWRVWAKGVRSSLDTARLSEQLCSVIAAWSRYRQARHIVTYLAFGSELNLSGLHIDKTKTFYVTRTWDAEAELSIHELDEEELEPHSYGYLQPSATAPKVAPETIDLVLVPGLAFSKRGERLGYGGGYYDRLLPELSTALWLGVAADRLVVPNLPSEAHDVKLNYLATESGITRC